MCEPTTILAGASLGRDPGPSFSTSAYLAAHKDVARSGANPLVHYLRYGARAGRVIERSRDAGSARP